MPHPIIPEWQVVGAILLKPEIYKEINLLPGHFTFMGARHVFEAIHHFEKRNEKWDLGSIKDYLITQSWYRFDRKYTFESLIKKLTTNVRLRYVKKYAREILKDYSKLDNRFQCAHMAP